MRTFLVVIVIWEGITALHAQDLGDPLRLAPISDVTVLEEGFGDQVVRGKPFSAVEERHSLHILHDGTRIETIRKNRLFRDGQGRTRAEQMNGRTMIVDPVSIARFRVQLDPSSRMAIKGPVRTIRPPQNPETSSGMPEATENLKPQLVNGVMAQGVRTTMIIPRGRIGNDREIKVVTERWVSNDLQMLIKSTNSDPRFGDTTYELTMIDQREPNASLFQIPAGYTVVEMGMGRRGGTSPVPGVGRNSRSPSSQ